MENTNENKSIEDVLKDLPISSENLAYAADEMIACGKCRRANPPNRLKCLYCGLPLEFSDEQSGQIKPVLRKLETWEKGFNLIYLPGEEAKINADKIREISRMTRIETETLQNLFAAGKPLPLARAESKKEAEIVRARLAETGIKTALLSDEKLAAENPPVRLRGMDFSDDKIYLITFNTDEVIEMKKDDLMLIVTGAIFQKRIEATEKPGKKGESKLLNATETATDEKIIDLYFRDDENGFRVEQKGFDFSCLEAEKSLLAAENMQILAKRLKSFAPATKLVVDYLPNRAAVGNVWEISERKDSKGLVRENFGKFNLGNVTVVSNTEQFTKYSRMLKNIL